MHSNFNELENRCLQFSNETKKYCRTIQYDAINKVYISQVVRSSSSIGANYIEANEKLGEKDLLMRMKIARKEAKETIFWLLHFDESEERNNLLNEVEQLRKIISAIIIKITK
jgi:four helix bundle protein